MRKRVEFNFYYRRIIKIIKDSVIRSELSKYCALHGPRPSVSFNKLIVSSRKNIQLQLLIVIKILQCNQPNRVCTRNLLFVGVKWKLCLNCCVELLSLLVTCQIGQKHECSDSFWMKMARKENSFLTND